MRDDAIRDTVRGLLADPDPVTLPARLADSGFDDFLRAEPGAAARGLFREQGRALVASPALDLLVAHALGIALAPDEAVVHPAIGASARPPASLVDGAFVLDGTVLAGHARARRLFAFTGDRVVAVDPRTIHIGPVRGLDPALGLATARGRLPHPTGPESAAAPEAAVAFARVALAAELLGVAGALVDRAVGHVGARHQFGRPIGAHQAVKHRLADAHVALAAADGVVDDAPDTPDHWVGVAAKALAGRAALTAAAAALQVCGGIGFSHEFGLHACVRRAQVLDALLGSYDQLTGEIGRWISADRVVPVLVSL